GSSGARRDRGAVCLHRRRYRGGAGADQDGRCGGSTISLTFSRKSPAGREKTWCFFHTRQSPASMVGYRGRKHSWLSPEVLISRSRVIAYPTPAFTKWEAL